MKAAIIYDVCSNARYRRATRPLAVARPRREGFQSSRRHVTDRPQDNSGREMALLLPVVATGPRV